MTENKKLLGKLHGGVLFEIFKYLNFKYLLSNIILVNSEWKRIVNESIHDIEMIKNNFKEWKKDQLLNNKVKKFKFYNRESELMIESLKDFYNLQKIIFSGFDFLFTFDNLIELLKINNNLNKIIISDCSLYHGIIVKVLNNYTLQNNNNTTEQQENNKTTTTIIDDTSILENNKKKRNFFQRLFGSTSSNNEKTNNNSSNNKNDSLVKEEEEKMKDLKLIAILDKFNDFSFQLFQNEKSLKLLQNFKNEMLNCLELYKTNISEKNLIFLLKNCIALKKLKLIECNGIKKFTFCNENINCPLKEIEINMINSDNCKIKFELNCLKLIENLKALSLMKVNLISENEDIYDFFKFIGNKSGCKKLKYLRIFSKFPILENNGIPYYKENSNIECLIIENSNFSDSDLLHLSKIFTNLKYLSIKNNNTNIPIKLIWKTFQSNLKRFEVISVQKSINHFNHNNTINNNLNNKDDESDDLLISSDELEYLNLSANKELFNLKIKCPNLKSLQISESDVGNGFSMLQLFNLEEINLSLLTNGNSYLTGSLLTNIKHLDLSYDKQLTDDRISELIPFMKCLNYLNLKMCSLIKNPKIVCNTLKVLLLSGTLINDEIMNNICINCKEIERLDINCCHSLFLPDLSPLYRLRSLNISENSKLKEIDHVFKIIKVIPSLRELYIRWRDGLFSNEVINKRKKEIYNSFCNLQLLDLTGSTEDVYLSSVLKDCKDLVFVNSIHKYLNTTDTLSYYYDWCKPKKVKQILH
ncbi:hypothetical protein ABK040_011388 [Willaertia magna]